MKIKITGLPQYQQRPGTVGPFPQLTFPKPYDLEKGFKNIVAQASGKCPEGQRKNPFKGTCEPIPSFNIPTPSLSFKPEGKGWMRNPETNRYEKAGDFATAAPPKKQMTEYNSAMPAMITAGMSWMNDLIENIQGTNDDVEYAKKLGMTDASEPVVKNVYSRGRDVMNVPVGADYAPNMMTPVQFQGRPVSEYLGYPGYGRNIFASKDGGLFRAQDGTEFTESLGLPTLVENPGDYARAPLPEMKGPEIPSFTAEQAAAQPEESTEGMNVEYALPVNNFKITSGFGHRDAPIKGASSNHNGVDLAVPVNSPVFAPMDGVVEKIYFNDKGGKQLVVRHSDGTRSGYAHLNDYIVNVGDKVTRGQKIALSGNTGNSSGPHLHFTFRNADGNFVDPIDYLNFNRTKKSSSISKLSNLDHNNPGNIHFGDFSEEYGGRPGRKDADGKVAVFPTMEAGVKAMNDLLFGPAYSNLTISQARNKWVNGNPNISTTSTNYIVNALGGDFRLSELSAAQRKKLFSEFVKWEDRSVYGNLKERGLVFKHGGVVPKNNNMKIKITGTPKQKFADGGRRVGDQMGYGLYRGQSVRDFNAFNKVDESDYYDRSLKNTESGIDRSKANIEAEKGEKIIARDGMSIKDIKGKKHSQGGTPLKAEPGSYILSDFIPADKKLQNAMGFDGIKSKRKGDNTWSKVLDSKVKSKDYNRLSEILQKAAAGKEVDRFELATAKNKMPVYADYVSKAVLGNELTKMKMGKPYEIPEMAIPALQKMFPEMAQQMSSGEEQQAPEQEPMMAYGGSYYDMPRADEGLNVETEPDDIIKWLIGKTREGSYTPTGLSNAYNRDEAYLQSWADILGMDVKTLSKMSNRDVQALIYDWSLQNNQSAINEMWKKYGLTNLGRRYKDLVNMTSKDSKGRRTFKFDKDLTPQQLAALKKAYTDNMFGVRQLDPIFPEPQISFTPEDIQPPYDPETPPVAQAPNKYYCSPVTGQVVSMPAALAKPNAGIIYYDTPEAAAANCAKKEDKPKDEGTKEKEQPVKTPPQEIPRLPYEEDVLSLGNALANRYGFRDVYPWRKRANAIGWDPAFYSTAAQEALLRSQAASAMQDASLYAGSPQVQAARQQQTQLASIPALMQARMQTNQANIGQDTQARISNAGIFNQAGMQDAAGANELMDMNARFIANKDASRAAGNTAVVNELKDLLTNSGNTYMMNMMYPQYAFNPLNYRTYFHDGKGLRDEAAATESDFASDYESALQLAKSQGLTDPKDVSDAAIKILTLKRGKGADNTNLPYPYYPERTRRGASRKQAMGYPGYYNDGGVTFVPVYSIGGLW